MSAVHAIHIPKIDTFLLSFEIMRFLIRLTRESSKIVKILLYFSIYLPDKTICCVCKLEIHVRW